MVDYLEGLNGPQREAVENYEGATLIIAGAGSGKTRVLTMRIAHMIQNGIKAPNILALTFTNKAAREMRERISKVVPYPELRGLWMGTFHSVFSRILRAEATHLGFPESFTIYDTADSRNVVKAVIREMELNEEIYKPNEVYARISMAKNNLVLPESYAANAHLQDEDRQKKQPQIYQVYARYMQRCKQNGAMDFDDLLLYMNVLLRDSPEVALKYGEQFRYILVDEYQDTNYSQYLIVKRLGEVYGNICVVGDDSQSIYSFRGARIENILRFQKDYPDARIFKLERNYRSTSNIVNAANSVIEHNTQKLPKKLFSENEPGDKITVICTGSDKEEASKVASDIHTTIYSRQASPDDFAILYRTNAQSRVMEEFLRGKNIPYRIYGGQSFYQRAEIKDMIAYLKFAVNPKDDEALKRIINFPARGIGETSIGRIEAAARQEGISMWEILISKSPAEMDVRGGAVKSIASFVENFSDIASRTQQTDAYTLAMEVAARSGILHHYQTSKSIEDESRMQNTEELLNSIQAFVEQQLKPELQQEAEVVAEEGFVAPEPTLAVWLQDVSLLTDMDQKEDENTPRVTLLTAHASKGLEFKYAYIVGMEENLFPSMRALTSADEVEEERRLFYVALTRAEKRATISFATTRFKWGVVISSAPSRFIREIDSQYVDMPPVTDFMEAISTSIDQDQPRYGGSQGRWSGREAATQRANHQRAVERKRERDIVTATTPVNTPPAGFRKVSSTVSSPSAGSISGASSSGAAGQPMLKAGDISTGSRVAHDRFGEGIVTDMEKTATDVKITVDFQKVGSKTLLLKFAKLRVLD